jgi:hypothetical protein
VDNLLGVDASSLAHEPFVASRFLEEALETSKETKRKLSLQQELDRAVTAQGRRLERVESALIEVSVCYAGRCLTIRSSLHRSFPTRPA